MRIVVIVDIQNKELGEDTLSPTASMRNFKYFLSDAVKHKSRVNQLYFIGSFFQAKVKNRLFVKLDSRYADYFFKTFKLFWNILEIIKVYVWNK